MKKAMQILSLLLAVILLVGLCACGKKDPGNTTATTEKPSETTEQPDVTTEKTEAKPNVPTGVDYGGWEFRILARNDSNYYSDELWVESAGGSKVDSAVYSRYKLIEQDYGVSFKLLTRKDQEGIDTWMNVNALSASQKDTFHLIATHGRNTAKYAVRNMAVDWNELKYVQLDADWWSQDARSQWATLSGRVYMMTGDLSYLSVGQAVGQFFNKILLVNAGLEYPYELVRNGEWTTENFQNYVKQLNSSLDRDGTGNITTDSTGYATGWWRGPMNIIYSTGGRWLTVTEDDITVIGVQDHDLTNAFDHYFEFLQSDGIMIGGNYAAAQKAFGENRVGFYDEITMRAADLKAINPDFFGLVPMPKYNSDVEKNYTFVNAATNTFTVPAPVKNDSETSERTSVILELMAFYGSRDVLPTYYSEMLTYGSMTDSDSVEMMGIIRNSLVYDLGYYYDINGFCDIGQNLAQELMESGTFTAFTTKYAELENRVTEPLSKWKALD